VGSEDGGAAWQLRGRLLYQLAMWFVVGAMCYLCPTVRSFHQCVLDDTTAAIRRCPRAARSLNDSRPSPHSYTSLPPPHHPIELRRRFLLIRTGWFPTFPCADDTAEALGSKHSEMTAFRRRSWASVACGSRRQSRRHVAVIDGQDRATISREAGVEDRPGRPASVGMRCVDLAGSVAPAARLHRGEAVGVLRLNGQPIADPGQIAAIVEEPATS